MFPEDKLFNKSPMPHPVGSFEEVLEANIEIVTDALRNKDYRLVKFLSDDWEAWFKKLVWEQIDGSLKIAYKKFKDKKVKTSILEDSVSPSDTVIKKQNKKKVLKTNILED